LFDFVSGRSKRAPGWMRNYHLEWLDRLFQEPRRFWKRYLLGNPLFFIRVFKVRIFKTPL
jgi:N-acetylglucosaminyldiphosphoundecaprenol N-acetyl-beta-D-mannosaminyltransferase